MKPLGIETIRAGNWIHTFRFGRKQRRTLDAIELGARAASYIAVTHPSDLPERRERPQNGRDGLETESG